MEHLAQMSLQVTANLVVTGGLLVWITKRHADKLDSLIVKMAEVKTILSQIKGDHEKLIRLEHQVSKADHDLNIAFEKLRTNSNKTKRSKAHG